ncbi:DUF4365 domain-containing protein [Nocardiopsis akebiae]|uniref:DUF4365 domain-containing protein n=1 Tax=Nocardiopsis akebiae TaxID=2831968 RepID=UPI0021110DB0|nr:DUF4365 domain-containing protein [Nocardiopsis akebiae]
MSGHASTALTDRAGTAIVELIVTQDLGWIFREQTVVDQGVDGHVEVAVEGHGTGRLIAVQIKSGPSYFRRVKGGWAFYYSARERQLWLGHALPVMVVMVDLDSRKAYWQRISPSTERQTKKGYAVTLPVDQTLDTAAEAWELAASGLEQRATERYEANLEVLPPPVRGLIETEGAGGAQSELVALHLAEGRANPAGTAQALMTARPTWMRTQTSWAWRALASYCANHDAMREAADALEIAAESGGDACGERLAAAAIYSAVQDRTRAGELVKAARERGGADLLVAIVEAGLEHPEGDASSLRIDAVLAAGGTDISTNATAQAFLAEQALRARDLDRAARHAERALTLGPEATEVMALVAQIYVQRALTTDAQVNDMTRAVELLSAAVEQRRQWAGPTLDLLVSLARVLTLRGEHGATLRWLLPPPYGTASSGEANDPVLLRYALGAAHCHGSSELVDSVTAQMTGSFEDRVAQAQLGLLKLTEPETKKLWSEELSRAEADQDWEAIAQVVHRLATLGVDVVDRLDPLMRNGILPLGTQRLPKAVLVLQQRPEEGIALLRSLASEDVSAAEYLVQTLVSMGYVDNAAEACSAAFERFRSSQFLTQRALIIFDKDPEQAESALREALRIEEAPFEQLMLATRLAKIATDAHRWSEAESILSTALTYQDPPPDALVWNLTEVQIFGAAGDRAAATISRHRPQCRSEAEARLWATAMINVAWDDAIASEAIALASRFSDTPDLATGLLTHLVTTTRTATDEDTTEPDSSYDESNVLETTPTDDRPMVPTDLHRRAFEVLQELIETHGAATGAQVIQGSSSEEMMGKVIELARSSAPPDLTDLLNKIARGQFPAGVVAFVARTTYTAVLVRRAAGQLVAVAVNDDEHQGEIEAATKAREGPAVVDLSTLLVLSQLSDADILTGQVSAMLLPRMAKQDVLRASVEAQSLGASTGRLGWDGRSGRPVFYEQTGEEYRLVRERTEAMEAMVRRTLVKDVTPSTLFGDVSDMIRNAPWTAAIELAAQEGVPLWCDDLAVRQLARSIGVMAFSTMAMAEVLRDSRLQSAAGTDEIDGAVQFAARVTEELLAEYVVDIPVTFEQLTAQASADGWVPAAAAWAISRPAWWGWQEDPINELLQLYATIRESDATQLPEWQYAAMLGAARWRSTPEEISRILAILALLGWDHNVNDEPVFEDLAKSCRNARRVARDFEDAGDPMLALPAARAFLSEAGVVRSEETVRALIAELGSPQFEA